MLEEIRSSFKTKAVQNKGFRVMSILVAVLLVSLYFILEPSETDSLPVRLVLGGMFLVAGISGFFVKWVAKNAYVLAFGMTLLLSAWILFLVMANDFQTKHVFWFFVIFASSCVALSRFWPVLLYSVLTVGMSFAFSPLLENPSFPPALFFTMEAMMAGGIFVGFNYLHREFSGLERDEKRFRLITEMHFEHCKDAILVTDQSGQVIEYNHLFQSMWSLKKGDLRGESLAYLGEQVAHLIPEDGHRPFQDESDWSQEIWDNPLLFLQNGVVVQRHSARVDIAGEGLWTVWYFRDITANWRSREALFASEAHNRAIVEALPDLTLHLGEDETILDAKIPGDPEYSGINLSDSAADLKALLGPQLAAEVRLSLGEGKNQEGTAVRETRLDWGGKVRDLELRVASSGPKSFLVMIRDVSQRKETERELIQRNFELDSFVYRASHDLKAPLNSMMGLLDLIRQNPTGEDNQLYLQLMDKSVRKLDTFIRNLTEFSRVSRSEIDRAEVNLPGLISEIQESIQHMENYDRVRWDVRVAEDCRLYADPFLLEIVLSNLVSNAVKYQDLSHPEPEIRVHLAGDAQNYTLMVADNGIGIPQKHQGRLFELFYRASNQSFGSGLGLYIARNAVEKMGGEIHFYSQEGEGTRFVIRLPRTEAQLSLN